jgi:ribonuclease R
VQPKTPLDREAYDRATSVYLPDEVIPMLPEVISNNLASLQPDKVRYAMTAVIEFTASGAPIGAEVFKSAIKSRRRFTYEEVDEYLAAKGLVKHSGPASGDGLAKLALAPEVDTLLGEMFELAMALRKRRFERGALELSMPEVKIDLDNDGRVCGAHVEKNTESHQIIEEFMLAANEAVARRLAEAGLLFLRRVHGNPDPRKAKALTEFIRSLGLPAENLQDRFEVQELLARVKGDPREHAVNFAALRSMQKAIYSPEEAGHYALASDCYCHFTSPIRRYPDLTVHRLLEGLQTGHKARQDPAVLVMQGDHCSEREQRAATSERELTKVKLLNYLSDKIGTEIEGVITGVESFGVFIMGKDLPAEGFVHITALGDDYFKFDRASHSINGFRSGNSFRLGDTVRVAVAAVDVDSRELDFRYLGRAGSAPKRSLPKTKPGPGRPPAGRPGVPKKGKPSGGGPMNRGKSDKTGKHRRKRDQG